jgi:hypothetical protein
VAKNINKLYQHHPQLESHITTMENDLIKQIRNKLGQNNAKAVKKDKGNSIIITIQNYYNNKINDFIALKSF